MLRHPFRVFFKLLGFFGLSLAAMAHFVGVVWLKGRAGDNRARAAWMQGWAQRMARLLKVEATYVGTPPAAAGILVCNHLSYLDVAVLGAARPMIFLAKREVRRWPVIGWLAALAGTLFIRRQHRGDVFALGEAFGPVVEQGVTLGLFPEGTSSDGQRVLFFHSSLFEPAAKHGWSVCPAWIGYSLADGSADGEACYWRDMTFLPHFLNLLSKSSIRATVVFGEPLWPGLNRKQMARAARAQVCALSEMRRAALKVAPICRPEHAPTEGVLV